jgi:hypothetical protein
MHEYWDILISQFKCPALKIELLLHNPLHRDLSRISQILKSETKYDFALITNHLNRLRRHNGEGSWFPWSPEKLHKIVSLGSGAFVAAAYRNILGRRPDCEGFAGYLWRTQGGESKLQVMREILSSPEADGVEVLWANLKGLLGPRVNKSRVVSKEATRIT